MIKSLAREACQLWMTMKIIGTKFQLELPFLQIVGLNLLKLEQLMEVILPVLSILETLSLPGSVLPLVLFES